MHKTHFSEGYLQLAKGDVTSESAAYLSVDTRHFLEF